MSSIIEGLSLFGTMPRFERVLREESSPVVIGEHSLSEIPIDSQVPALEGILAQEVESGGMADTEVCGVGAILAGDISLVDESRLFFFHLSPLFVTHFFFLFFFLVRW